MTTKARGQIVIKPGESEYRRAAKVALHVGATARERQRFATSPSLSLDMDHAIELIGSKRVGGGRSPILSVRAGPEGRMTHVGPYPYVYSSDMVLRLGERCMERLYGDQSSLVVDENTVVYQRMILTEACLALNIEARVRGLVPQWDPDEMRRAIEAMHGIGVVGEQGEASTAEAAFKGGLAVTSYGPGDHDGG